MDAAVRITERDKRLLLRTALALAAAAVMILVIRPLYTANKELQQQIEKNTVRIAETRQRENGLSRAEMKNQELREQLAGLCADACLVMENRQLDRMVTDIVIRHGLTPRRLKISVSEEPADFHAYLQDEGKGSNPDGRPGVYLARIELEAAGEMEELDSMIDELALDSRGIWIASIEWEMEDGGRNDAEEQRSVQMELYVVMYQDAGTEPSRIE